MPEIMDWICCNVISEENKFQGGGLFSAIMTAVHKDKEVTHSAEGSAEDGSGKYFRVLCMVK